MYAVWDILWSTQSVCLVTVCLLFCLLICQCTLTAGVLIYCLHTHRWKWSYPAQAICSVLIESSYNRAKGYLMIFNNRLGISSFIHCSLTSSLHRHCFHRAVRRVQYKDNRWRGIFFLIQQRHTGWYFSMQWSGNFHQYQTALGREVI